jgi:hypothetical protein
MSHSWHDDGRIKFQKLQVFATRFLQKRNRHPTFWLDKVCIDQDAIADGLRALPINVMACRKVLVVCGPTYPTRLWCAWELCTLFSFRDADKVAEGVEILLLDSDGDDINKIGNPCPSWSQLLAFDVDEAHCYDPNEESKLRMVIEAVGSERFNRNVRDLASACQPQRIGTQSSQG